MEKNILNLLMDEVARVKNTEFTYKKYLAVTNRSCYQIQNLLKIHLSKIRFFPI